MKIAIAGIGYVGLSNAVLLAQRHEVTAVDVSQERVDAVNAKRSPIADKDRRQTSFPAARPKAPSSYCDEGRRDGISRRGIRPDRHAHQLRSANQLFRYLFG